MSTLPMNQGAYGQPVMQDISRQRKLAEQLQSQSQENLQGQMVSGHYVAPSWTQQLARLVQAGTGAYIGNKADEKEKDYNATKARKLAEFLKDNQARTTQQGTTETSVMPAYEPSQQDRFGSPLQGVQRQPVVTSTPNMVTETPDQVQQRQRMQAYQLAGEYGNTPEIQMAIADMNHARDRGEIVGDRQEERTYQDGREEKLYNRNRTDKLSDTEAEHKYQGIQHQIERGERIEDRDLAFAQQWKMQNSSQNFQAGMQSNSQKFQAGQNALSRQQDIAQTKLKIAGENNSPKLQEGERKAATLLSRLKNSKSQLDAALKASPNAAKPELTAQGIRTLTLGVGEPLANMATSDERQQVESAQLDMLDAALTLGTGAAYTKEQLEGYRKSYFPQLGDSAKAVKDKQDRLNNIIKSAEIAAGRGASLVPDPIVDNSTPNANVMNAVNAEIERRKARK